ncbi:MAG: nuclear transport factor 2 family protein [Gemmatimonadales bacterium]
MTARTRIRFTGTLVVVLALGVAPLARAQGIEAPRVPLRTAVAEINTLRDQYEGAFNKKDATVLTAYYAPDAVVLRADGSTLLGQSAIGKSLEDESAHWTQTKFASDTMRVFGNTAWDVGTMSSRDSAGTDRVSHYLVVLRRGIKGWKISSVAVVPPSAGKAKE